MINILQKIISRTSYSVTVISLINGFFKFVFQSSHEKFWCVNFWLKTFANFNLP